MSTTSLAGHGGSNKLVKPYYSKLGSSIVDQLVGAAVAGQAGRGHDVTLLGRNHLRQEGLDRPKVGHHVHVKRAVDLG